MTAKLWKWETTKEWTFEIYRCTRTGQAQILVVAEGEANGIVTIIERD